MMATTKMNGVAKKAANKKVNKKKQVDPQLLQKRKQLRVSRQFFERLGFVRIKSDGTQITFNGRTGEIDDIFVSENIMLLVEYTVGKETTGHVSKKSILYDKIKKDQTGWVDFAVESYPEFKQMFDDGGYIDTDYRVGIVYISTDGVSDEIANAFDYIQFLDGTKFRYFEALGKTIHKSARFEFFKYLGLKFNEIGKEIKTTSTSTKAFEGHVLPESFSSFPKDFKVVSFYADPATLLMMSYVFRRDSWRDEEAMYQRVLQKGRMNQMRKYLTTEKRVFVNNIIVTLPDDTSLNQVDGTGKNINPKSLTSVVGASITVPLRSNVIGIVDGQHRVFCYHEGNDKYESKIKSLRDRQNLLVTGIIFPKDYTDVDRRRFEAKLFLEINDKQKRTGSELKQSIELILNPYSTIAIAKSVIQRLNASGALNGFLQTNYFDPPRLIKTTSIVSYGLRPLLKLDGEDSLFSAWSNKDKIRLSDLQAGKQQPDGDDLLREYIEFCVKSINALLIAAKKSDLARWRLSENSKERYLSPTIINGFIVCLRLMIKNGKLSNTADYESKLGKLASYVFSKYKSSAWKALGDDLYKSYFA